MKRATSGKKASGLIKCCSFLILMLVSAIAFAQKGKVTVVRDPLFDTLLAKRTLLNRKGGVTGAQGFTSSYGYRVQIYNGSARNAAYSAQARCNREAPEIRTYISYREPNFKVTAGDFRTRLEAERFKSQLTGTFSPMFVISEKINPPKTVVPND